MADNTNDDMVMDLDLNQEPLIEPPLVPPPPSSFGYGLLNELETAHSRIEDRIRQLEAATARARQRQRWRHTRNNPELSYTALFEPHVPAENPNQEGNEIGEEIRANDETANTDTVTVERGRNSKRDISQLAKALEMDLDSKKTDDEVNGNDDESGGFFDCTICLEMARDPILTCCGHLFCWSCFYQLSYVDSTAKECPVCKGEVTDSSITPIYGNGKNQPVLKLESGIYIPPRPRARKVENNQNISQPRAIRSIPHIPVAEALRRIRTGIGSIGENPLLQGVNNIVDPTSDTSLLHNSGRNRSRQFSRVISESAASLSSISSALNNAERLVEDLETYISDRVLSRTVATHAQILPEINNFLANHAQIQQPEPQNAEMDASLPLSSSSQRSVATAAVVQLDNVSTDTSVEIDLTISSSSRRTTRGLSLEGGTSREPGVSLRRCNRCNRTGPIFSRGPNFLHTSFICTIIILFK